jgi:hypothetical protein
MTRHNALNSWTNQVVSAFPCLSRPQATVLALYSFGAILADRCGLSSVALMLVRVLGVPYLTIRSRLQEFYQPASAKSGTRRRDLDVTICFAPLITWALKGWPSNHLALALDATSLGDRFTVLSLSILYRGSACPVAWKIMQANVRHAWKPEWIALLQLVHRLVPAGWTVVVLTDRGLYARWLFHQIVALGWHPLMRITSKSTFRKNGSRTVVPVTALVPKPGQRWKGHGLAFPRRARSRLDCTLFACWEFGHEEPWFILTDLEPDQSEGLWYAMRAWIEHGFKLLKSQGWQWQKSRMTDPDRASRLWLVLAVATRYVLAVGGEADASDTDDQTGPLPPFASGTNRTAEQVASRPSRTKRHAASGVRSPRAPRKRASGTKERVMSVFRQGMAVLMAVLIAGHALPKPHWKPEPWLEIRANLSQSADQPPTPIPKNPSL